MSQLRIFAESDGSAPVSVDDDHAAIAERLAGVDVRFERWPTPAGLAPGASPDQVIAAYRADIDRLMQQEGYRSVDVVSLYPEHPEREAFRKKFLDEHTHSEDEVRF